MSIITARSHHVHQDACMRWMVEVGGAGTRSGGMVISGCAEIKVEKNAMHKMMARR